MADRDDEIWEEAMALAELFIDTQLLFKNAIFDKQSVRLGIAGGLVGMLQCLDGRDMIDWDRDEDNSSS